MKTLGAGAALALVFVLVAGGAQAEAGRRAAAVADEILFRDGGLFAAHADGATPSRLTRPGAGTEYSSSSWSPDGSTIAFVRSRNDRAAVWVMDADGSHSRQLTHPRARPATGFFGDSRPIWSPDGSRVAFIRKRVHSVGIGLVGADGRRERIVRDLPGTDWGGFSWLPDRSRLVLCGFGRRPKPYVLTAGGTLRAGRRCLSGAAWLPDGSRYLLVRGDRRGNTQIWVSTADGRLQATLTNDVPVEPLAHVHNAMPMWSPDGSRVAFVSDRKDSGAEDLFVMSADGSGERRLTWSGGVELVSWSPDSSRLAFTRLDGYDRNVYVIGSDGRGLRRVADAADAEDLAWRPASRPPRLAPRPPIRPRPRHRVRVLPTYPRTGSVRLGDLRRFGSFRGTQLDLSPDGRLLSYTTTAGALGVVDLAAGSVRTVPTGRALEWDSTGLFSPDGTKLLYRVDRVVEVVPVAGGPPVAVTRDAARTSVRWLSDGRVAYVDRYRRLVFARPGGPPQPTGFRIPNPPGEDNLFLAYAVSPDGSRVLYTKDCRIWLRDLRTGERRLIRRGGFVPLADAWSPDGSMFVLTNSGLVHGCRMLVLYPPNENRLFTAAGRRIAELPGGGTSWSRDGRWLLVFNGQHGSAIGGSQPLDAVSLPDLRISHLLRFGNAGSAFVGPGDWIVFGRFAHPEVFARAGEGDPGPALWVARLETRGSSRP